METKKPRTTEPREAAVRSKSGDGTEVIFCTDGTVVVYDSSKNILADSSNPGGPPPPPPGNP